MGEEQLIIGLKKGDTTAYNELVKLFSDKVFNTSVSILQNSEDAEDITQEVFIEIFKSIHGFKGESKLSTWIYRITVIKAFEFLRKKKRKKRFAIVQSLFGIESVLPETDVPHFYHPGVQLENKERSAILFTAIDQLAENQKTAFILHKIEGLSYAEVADVMKTSVPSVESLLFRAKQNLQKLLANYYNKNEK
ncbi:MAG TPA: RNA polymerase sigma factor [Bacteroidia bacterium]|nr:RNA polymerase sigma factor [Bacteroidia bacterium]